MQRLLTSFCGGFAALAVACGPSVTTVSMTPPKATIITKDEKVTFTASPLDKEGKQVVDAILKLQWSSSNPDVASVANGVVTAKKSGDAKITAAVGDTKGVVDVVVSIPATLTLEPATNEIVGVKKQVKLTPVVKDDAGREVAGAVVIWSTSDGNIATIADDGTVTAEGAGTADIKAACGEASATAKVVITHPPVAGIALEPATQTFEKVGDAVRLKANLTDAAGQPILGLNPTWTSADPKVATVSEAGQVQAVKKGKTIIKAAVGDKVAEAQIIVLK